MCLHYAYFSKYVWSSHIVRTHDGSILLKEGVCMIHIRLSDGLFLTLKEIMHVPVSCHNLITLSTLNCDGYKRSYEGGMLNISKGHQLIASSNHHSSLYSLINKSIVEGVLDVHTLLGGGGVSQIHVLKI